MAGADVDTIIREAEEGKRHKAAYWNSHWQLAYEYYNNRKADFTSSHQPGAFLHADIWTALPAQVAEKSASALGSSVWPDNHSFNIEPFGEGLKDDAELEDFFAKATEDLQNDLDEPEGGFSLALEECMLSYVIDGTPAMLVEQGKESLYRFGAYNVQQFSAAEGRRGVLNCFYLEPPYTVRTLVEEFTIEGVSQKVRTLHNAGSLNDPVRVIHAIKPRTVNPRGGAGKKNMAFMSVHVEADTKHPLRESGYEEQAIFAPRLAKRTGEIYGRGWGMRALPDVLQLDAQWEIVTLAGEKLADPALYSFFSNDIDTSAGALNALSWDHKMMQALGSREPIGRIQDVGDISYMVKLIERLEATLNTHFMIDRLIDQDSRTDMTYGEFSGRRSIRQELLRAPASRLYGELFDPMIRRCFNIGLRSGRYGHVEGTPEYNAARALSRTGKVRTIPRKLVEMQESGRSVYKIRYTTPAARERRLDEAQGIINWSEYLGKVSQVDRTALEQMNVERISDTLADIWNVPDACKNKPAEKKALRDQAQAAAQEDRKLAQAQGAAQVAKDMGAAKAAGSKARGEKVMA